MQAEHFKIVFTFEVITYTQFDIIEVYLFAVTFGNFGDTTIFIFVKHVSTKWFSRVKCQALDLCAVCCTHGNRQGNGLIICCLANQNCFC